MLLQVKYRTWDILVLTGFVTGGTGATFGGVVVGASVGVLNLNKHGITSLE